jgi:hypothetical protein
VTDCHSALQAIELARHVRRHRPHAANDARGPFFVEDGNTDRLLSSVLERVQPELREMDSVAMPVYAKDAAHVRQAWLR